MTRGPSDAPPTLDTSDEIAALFKADPSSTGYYAFVELHAGRLEWLAEHIRRCDFQIHPVVARKLLELIDGSHPEFALKVIRRPGRNPKAKPKLETEVRNFELALEVARKGGFARAMNASICAEVGKASTPSLAGLTVERLVRPYRELALSWLNDAADLDRTPPSKDISGQG